MRRAYLKSPNRKVEKGLKAGEYQKVYYISDSDYQDVQSWPDKEARAEAEIAVKQVRSGEFQGLAVRYEGKAVAIASYKYHDIDGDQFWGVWHMGSGMEGAGTVIMYELAKEAVWSGLPMGLEATEGSIPFYKGLGMTQKEHVFFRWELDQMREFISRYENAVNKGGLGSGNWGHAGRPGEVGGSATSEEGRSDREVFHGTAEKLASRITKEGLVGDPKTVFGSVDIHEAMLYGESAASKYGGNVAIIVVDKSAFKEYQGAMRVSEGRIPPEKFLRMEIYSIGAVRDYEKRWIEAYSQGKETETIRPKPDSVIDLRKSGKEERSRDEGYIVLIVKEEVEKGIQFTGVRGMKWAGSNLQ